MKTGPLRGVFALALLLILSIGQLSVVNAVEAPPSETGNVVTLTDFWRDARHGESGTTSAQRLEDAVLINVAGDAWRHSRHDEVLPTSAWLLGISVVLIALVYLIRGQIKLEQGRSGRTVLRWSALNRWLHWYVALLFIALAISGLSLMWGKYLLIPLLGKSAFAEWASFSKTVHNYGGPLFVIGLVLMVALWMKDNFPNAIDLKWLASGGGILNSGHPSAGFMNGGEKAWFWVIFVVGIVVSLSGLFLNFPNFEQFRNDLQLATYLHAISAAILIAGFLGHLYIATLGTEGALEGMWRGEVDENWAKQHHDLWYQQIKNQND